MTCLAPISIGELYDKITILEIKAEKITDMQKRNRVVQERTLLQKEADKFPLTNHTLQEELKSINQELWTIEDQIREKEAKQEFDQEFIGLARSVYFTNDKRASVKKQINELTNSLIQEVKSYSDYTTKNQNNPSPNTFPNDLTFSLVTPESTQKNKDEIDIDNCHDPKQLFDQGNRYESTGDFSKALECYHKALLRDTNNPILLNQIGMCYNYLDDQENAIRYFIKITAIINHPDVYNNLATCYISMRDYRNAEKYYELALQYGTAESRDRTIYGLANIYFYTKRYDKSIEYYEKVSTYKDNHIMMYNCAFPYLAKHDFKIGLELYEERLKDNSICPQTKLKRRVEIPGVPYWDGVKPCTHLLVVYEQGVGDNIMFYRYLLELADLYPKMSITYFCKSETVGHLFKTRPNISIVLNLDNIRIFDHMIFIMSLAKILNIKSITPLQENYIKPNDERRLFWTQKLENIQQSKPKKPLVGITFNGLLTSFIEKQIPLKYFEIFNDLSDEIDFVCLHKKDDIVDDLKTYKGKMKFYNIDTRTPFQDSVAILQNLDLFITIDTAITHLAGVMNVDTWLLLGYGSDWRWFANDGKSAWYSTVELLRMKENKPLSNILPMVKEKLKERFLQN